MCKKLIYLASFVLVCNQNAVVFNLLEGGLSCVED
jgi:hypothetical protein